MCAPLALIPVAMTIASTAAAVAAQQQQAQFQNAQFKATNQAANANYIQQTNAQGVRLQQASAQASQQSQQSGMQTAQAVGHAAAAAADSNVAGNSVNELFNDFHAIDARNQNAMNQNLNNEWQQGMQNTQAFQANAQQRITAATPPPSQVNYAGAAAQIGGAFAGAMDQTARWNQQGPYNPQNTGSNLGWAYKPLIFS